jgi:hypothetical protein
MPAFCGIGHINASNESTRASSGRRTGGRIGNNRSVGSFRYSADLEARLTGFLPCGWLLYARTDCGSGGYDQPKHGLDSEWQIRHKLSKSEFVNPLKPEDLSAHSNALFAKGRLKVRAQTFDTGYAIAVERESVMLVPKIDDKDIERMIDIIGDGELTVEAQEQLYREGLWPLYESLRQTAYAAFVSGHSNG